MSKDEIRKKLFDNYELVLDKDNNLMVFENGKEIEEYSINIPSRSYAVNHFGDRKTAEHYIKMLKLIIKA